MNNFGEDELCRPSTADRQDVPTVDDVVPIYRMVGTVAEDIIRPLNRPVKGLR
ncbi:MAG TPA: hypothetical protein VGH11_07095 [Jatrophihabitans sp.]